MKIICTLISIIFAISFVALTISMYDNTLVSHVDYIPDTNAIIYSIILGLSAFLSGFMFSQSKLEQVKSDANKQVRKAEKNGIDTKESLDKINRLNSKIETLEVALQEALKNKQ